MKNRYPQPCLLCGTVVPPGRGRLQYYSDEELDECGFFDEKAGWKVRCLDEDACRRAIEAAEQRLRDAEAQRKREQEEQRRALAEDRERYERWKAEHLAGLVETTCVPTFYVQSPDACREGEWTIVRGVKSRPLASFTSGWPTTGDHWYEVVLPDAEGTRVLACYYGSAAVYYVPAHVADRWYRERFEAETRTEEDRVRTAMSVMDHRPGARYAECHGADFYQWVWRHHAADVRQWLGETTVTAPAETS